MNIEKTISEHAVSDILTPMLESQDRIVTEDVAPLFNDATGLDTPPASGSVTTTIEESRSVISAIIRKAWTATLTMLGGASVIGYITAAYTYLLNRLQGNETYGIPDRRSEISASSPLAANLALLNDRKIGGADTIDGISVAQLFGSSAAANAITELTDETRGWTMDRSLPTMNGVTKATIGCKTLHAAISGSLPNAEELTFPDLDHIDTGETGAPQVNVFYGASIKKIDMPEVKSVRIVNASYSGYFYNITGPCEILMPKCTSVWCAFSDNYPRLFHTTPGVRKWVLGKIESATNLMNYGNFINLMHFEIGAGTAVSLNLAYWSATNCLDASRTDLIEEGSTAQNNLQQFLSNFRKYIAERLAKYTGAASGKPLLTLSQAVRNAIEADGIASYIKNDRNWEISPEPNNQ